MVPSHVHQRPAFVNGSRREFDGKNPGVRKSAERQMPELGDVVPGATLQNHVGRRRLGKLLLLPLNPGWHRCHLCVTNLNLQQRGEEELNHSCLQLRESRPSVGTTALGLLQVACALAAKAAGNSSFVILYYGCQGARTMRAQSRGLLKLKRQLRRWMARYHDRNSLT